MTSRKVIGLCVLCALMISVTMAQGANAATKWVTCDPNAAVKDFATAHCRGDQLGNQFGHSDFTILNIVLTNGQTNPETNAATVAKLRATISGINVVFTATGVSGTGTAENAGGVGKAVGTLTYTGITVTPNKCSVPGGTVETKELKAATGATVGAGLKFEPAGEVFAEFELTGAECPAALKKNYKVLGSLVGTISGATTTSTHNGITEQGTLRLESAEGPKAGLEGAITIKGNLAKAVGVT